MSDIEELSKAGARWYVAHTYSGYENKVKTNIEKIVENRGLGDLIFDVRVPVEITKEVDENGVEKEVETKLFPCYVLIKMIMNDESWHVVRNISGVTGFVGPGSKPVPLTEAEAAALCADIRESKRTFALGDSVEIVEGVFKGYSGKIGDISTETDEVTVIVPTVGRDMPIRLETKFIRKKED